MIAILNNLPFLLFLILASYGCSYVFVHLFTLLEYIYIIMDEGLLVVCCLSKVYPIIAHIYLVLFLCIKTPPYLILR